MKKFFFKVLGGGTRLAVVMVMTLVFFIWFSIISMQLFGFLDPEALCSNVSGGHFGNFLSVRFFEFACNCLDFLLYPSSHLASGPTPTSLPPPSSSPLSSAPPLPHLHLLLFTSSLPLSPPSFSPLLICPHDHPSTTPGNGVYISVDDAGGVDRAFQ